ncbi:MAG: hypothetical protein RL266_2122 [Bacteroidota bacterium]|jgi:hypothetical protein
MKVKPILAIAASLAYVVFHVLVDWHYRPNADDFAGMHYASRGLPGLGYAMRFYMEWEGPFLSMIVQGLWMRALYIGIPGGVIISFIKTLLLFSSVYMYGGVIQFLSGKRDPWLALLAGSVTVITLYSITSSVDEIWHWVMGTVVYVHPLIFLQIAIGLLFRKKFVWAILPLAYLMQSRATYAILLYALITSVTIYAWAVKADWRKALTVSNVVLLGFFLIYLFAPGNAKRVSVTAFEWSHYVHEYRREILNIFLSFNLAKTDRLLLGLLAFVPLLPYIDLKQFPKGKWWILIPGAAYLLFVLAHGMLFVYATGYAAWNRVFSMHSFLFFMAGLFYFYLLQQWAHGKWNLERYGSVAAGFATLILIFNLYEPLNDQLQLGKEFSEAYDTRHEQILSYNGSSEDTLFVQALPQPGVLHFWDFTEDAGGWISDDFRMRYEIPYHVALRPEE